MADEIHERLKNWAAWARTRHHFSRSTASFENNSPEILIHPLNACRQIARQYLHCLC